MSLAFGVEENMGQLNGSLYLDDFNLIENGPSIDVATAPIETIVERVAKRQFMGLWAARNKTSGLIPNSSDNVAIGALNTTTGVVWNLPSAIRRGWVTQSDADAYMGNWSRRSIRTGIRPLIFPHDSWIWSRPLR